MKMQESRHRRARASVTSVETSRNAKAQKIALLSEVVQPPHGAAMLYIGSNAGYIRAYFSRLGFGKAGTFAVDVADAERVGSGSQSAEARGAKLPFPDGRFDFIISNHVIKHFAGRAQHAHWLRSVAACTRLESSTSPFRTAGVSLTLIINSPS